MTNPIISIIIVNWNGKKWLKPCLDSLRNQTIKEYEVIVVDNASTDDSVSYLKNKYPEVVVIETGSNIGFAGGNNVGIKAAKGEYVLMLNNDTKVDMDFLEKMIAFFRIHKYDVLAPIETGYNNPKCRRTTTTIDIFGHPVHFLFDPASKRQDFYLGGTCLLFKKTMYQETKGLDNNFFMYFEETDWFWRLQLLNKTIGKADNIFVYHAGAGSTGSGIKANLFLWRNQNNLQMLIKNYRFCNLLWILSLYFLMNVVEILGFLILFKPKIAVSYIQGWWFNIKYLKRTLERRRWVQKKRKVGDFQIFIKMYHCIGKFRHLYQYLKK